MRTILSLLVLFGVLLAATLSTGSLREVVGQAPAVVLAFVLFEARDVPFGCGVMASSRRRPCCKSSPPAHARRWQSAWAWAARGGRRRARLCVSALVLHAVAGWYAYLRVDLARRGGGGHHSLGVEVANAGLVYLALVAMVLVQWRSGRGLPERVAELEVMVSEGRVQYDAMCTLLRKRGSPNPDDDDDESDLEGDEREHLIVPPSPVEIPHAIRGRPEAVLPLALEGKAFDRAVALKIAGRIRRRGYTLAAYYDDIRLAFPELSLYLAQGAPERSAGAEGGHAEEGASARPPSPPASGRTTSTAAPSARCSPSTG